MNRNAKWYIGRAVATGAVAVAGGVLLWTIGGASVVWSVVGAAAAVIVAFLTLLWRQ